MYVSKTWITDVWKPYTIQRRVLNNRREDPRRNAQIRSDWLGVHSFTRWHTVIFCDIDSRPKEDNGSAALFYADRSICPRDGRMDLSRIDRLRGDNNIQSVNPWRPSFTRGHSRETLRLSSPPSKTRELYNLSIEVYCFWRWPRNSKSLWVDLRTNRSRLWHQMCRFRNKWKALHGFKSLWKCRVNVAHACFV